MSVSCGAWVSPWAGRGRGCARRPRGSLVQRLARTAVLPWRTRAKVVMTVDPDMIPVTRLVTTIRRRKLVVDVHEDYERLLADRAWAKSRRACPARLIVRAGSKLAAAPISPWSPTRTWHRTTPSAAWWCRTSPTMASWPRPRRRAPPRGVRRGPVDEPGPVRHGRDRCRGAGVVLDLVGPVAPSDWDQLEARIEEPDLAGRVRLHGRQPPAEAWRDFQGAWASLAMLRPPAVRERCREDLPRVPRQRPSLPCPPGYPGRPG